MTDIVTRLRGYKPTETDCHDGANEIKRLQKEIAECYEDIKRMNADMNAEIFRLRAEVKQFQEVITEQAHNREAGYAKRDAEIERLRELLRHVINNPWDYDAKRVREALGE